MSKIILKHKTADVTVTVTSDAEGKQTARFPHIPVGLGADIVMSDCVSLWEVLFDSEVRVEENTLTITVDGTTLVLKNGMVKQDGGRASSRHHLCNWLFSAEEVA